MEADTEETYLKDELSQSYLQSIEKITGTKKNVVHEFEIPKEILEQREKAWNNLFNKYLEQVPDDIEINLTTLAPQRKMEDCSPNRVPMRKSPTMVQYWVNTGNPPFKAFIDEVEDSECSLSEKEPTNSLPSISTDGKQNSDDSSSCSSVDTAAYILSNTNVTKKAETMAIMEGAKYSDVEVSDDVSERLKSTPVNEHASSSACNGVLASDNVDKCDRRSHVTVISSVVMEQERSNRTNKQEEDIETTKTLTKSSSGFKHSCNDDTTVKVGNSETGCNKNGYETSTVLQCDKSLKHLRIDNNANGTNDTLELKSEDTRQVPSASNCIFNTTFTPFHRKKLYSGRDSPVDLTTIQRYSSCKLVQSKLLHPALDPTLTVTESTSRKKRSISRKKSVKKNNVKRNQDLNSPVHNNSQNSLLRTESDLSKPHNVDEKYGSHASCTEHKDTNNSIGNDSKECSPKGNETKERSLPTNERLEEDTDIKNSTASSNPSTLNKPNCINMNPIVRLERLQNGNFLTENNNDPSLKRALSQTNMQNNEKEKTRNTTLSTRSTFATPLNLPLSSKIQHLDTESLESDQSTILIYECKNSASIAHSSLSDCSSFTENSAQDLQFSPVENKSSIDDSLNIENQTSPKKDVGPVVTLKQLGSTDIKTSDVSVSCQSPKKEDTKRTSNELYPKAVVLVEKLSPEAFKSHTDSEKRCLRSVLRTPPNSTPSNLSKTTSLKTTNVYTIGSRICKNLEKTFNKNNCFDTAEKRKDNVKRRPTLIVTSSDEEDDFVKLIKNSQYQNNVAVDNVIPDTTSPSSKSKKDQESVRLCNGKNLIETDEENYIKVENHKGKKTVNSFKKNMARASKQHTVYGNRRSLRSNKDSSSNHTDQTHDTESKNETDNDNVRSHLIENSNKTNKLLTKKMKNLQVSPKPSNSPETQGKQTRSNSIRFFNSDSESALSSSPFGKILTHKTSDSSNTSPSSSTKSLRSKRYSNSCSKSSLRRNKTLRKTTPKRLKSFRRQLQFSDSSDEGRSPITLKTTRSNRRMLLASNGSQHNNKDDTNHSTTQELRSSISDTNITRKSLRITDCSTNKTSSPVKCKSSKRKSKKAEQESTEHSDSVSNKIRRTSKLLVTQNLSFTSSDDETKLIFTNKSERNSTRTKSKTRENGFEYSTSINSCNLSTNPKSTVISSNDNAVSVKKPLTTNKNNIQNGVTNPTTVTSLIFQTKSYYDTDSEDNEL